tara:strand:+ start:5390 stop:8275 length:2886 start_codon:yes stop_codon:yes gene_type:complete
MDDLLTEFLTETGESLAVLDVELVKFEQDPSDADILSNIFRLVHTIKGTSGFLGLPRLEKVAHAGEDVLGKFRDGDLEVTPEAVTLVLKTIDSIRDSLQGLEDTGSEPEGDDNELIALLCAMADGESAPAEESAPVEEAAADEPEAAASSGPVLNEQGFPVAAELLDEVAEATSQGVKAPSEKELEVEMAAEMAADKEKEETSPPAAAANVPAETRAADVPAEKKEKMAGEKSVAQQTIRVNVDLLENLMTLVSELVLTRNSLNQMVRGRDDSEFVVPLQRLSHITSDLQEGVMKTRMQPIGNAWAKLPRIVRDLALEANKKIDLQMVGAETELDRQVLELIKDPLTHMVRNSADHGLESPTDRQAAGKPETGVILLQAFHEGGHIVIEIGDDGRGLNLERIKAKIIENGLVSESELDAMPNQQIHQFIFHAGFSTAEKVTSVSGRGVGMDVVRTNIEKIGGTVELKSEEGKGSTFTIKIPLTLAIVSALIVECAKERFAIPQISVLELVRASAHSENAIEMINEAPVLRLRNRLLPLVKLQDLLLLESEEEVEALMEEPLALPPAKTEEIEVSEVVVEDGEIAEESSNVVASEEVDDLLGSSDPESETFIIVSQVGNYTFGIIVDRVFDTEEIVVKPVAPILRDIDLFSGNTILGDGSVIMILDPNGIASATGEISMGASNAEAVTAADATHSSDRQAMLVFLAGGEELKAVPLALVARLEEIDMATVEFSNSQRVVQYRGQLMPLIAYDESHEWKTEGYQSILVFTDRDRSMGLVVDQIVDIVEDEIKVELQSSTPGLVGSAVISGKATDVIDAGYYLTQGFSDWFSAPAVSSGNGSGAKRRVLLVDDSPFFRNLMTPLLSVAGYDVTAVESADAALDIREKGSAFDVIVSDIEMPEMSGFDFARKIKEEGPWQDVPLVALSSHATERDFEKGREVGFSDYVSKFDRDALLETLLQTME